MSRRRRFAPELSGRSRWHSSCQPDYSCVVGCGPSSDRLEVGGAVSLDGTPLDSGSIRFSSIGEGQKLVSTGALVKDGEYLVPQEKGLPPGKYRVEITSPEMNAPPVMVRESPGSRGYPTEPERIPV